MQLTTNAGFVLTLLNSSSSHSRPMQVVLAEDSPTSMDQSQHKIRSKTHQP
jgi:hypothetical protein